MSRKSKKTGQKPNATVLATKAGCSRQLVSRLLARGFSGQQICARIKENKVREAARAARSNAQAKIPANGFPALPVPVPPFAQSEAIKEHALSELRLLELQRRRGELLPLQPLRAISVTVAHFQRDVLWRWPDELSQELSMRPGDEIADVLRRHIEALFHASSALFEAECRKYNIRLPPEPPPRPVSSRLPYFEQYIAGSTSGKKEHISGVKEIGTPQWMAAHPSVDIQQSFQILASKRQWDADMAALLNRRSEWDLPPEPVEPPPEPEEPPDAA
jgi:hypothetical protein